MLCFECSDVILQVSCGQTVWQRLTHGVEKENLFRHQVIKDKRAHWENKLPPAWTEVEIFVNLLSDTDFFLSWEKLQALIFLPYLLIFIDIFFPYCFVLHPFRQLQEALSPSHYNFLGLECLNICFVKANVSDR